MTNGMSRFERRLRDLENQFANMERNGQIVATKFDKENKRWFVKINEGEDLTPSGEDSQHAAAKDTFKSDWLAWKSFAHGTIRASMPPRNGMIATIRSPNGRPESSTAEPYGYGPENPSPHDKEDEVFFEVSAPRQTKKQKDGGEGDLSDEDRKNQTLQIHHSKDFTKVTLGKSTWTLTADKVTVQTGTIEYTATDTITLKGGGDGTIVLDGDGITMRGALIRENP